MHITLNLIEVDEAPCCFLLFFITAYSICSGPSGPYGALIHRWESPEVQSRSLGLLYHIWLGCWRDMSVLKDLHYSHGRKYLQDHNCIIMHFMFYWVILPIRDTHMANMYASIFVSAKGCSVYRVRINISKRSLLYRDYPNPFHFISIFTFFFAKKFQLSNFLFCANSNVQFFFLANGKSYNSQYFLEFSSLFLQ